MKNCIIRSSTDRQDQILTSEALDFIAKLSTQLESERQILLAARTQRQAEFDGGLLPNFLKSTENIRQNNWTVAPIPNDLKTRTVEITGPASDRKMVINALNSGADCYMADFEDSMAPVWANIISGQLNVRDAINRTISLKIANKEYKLNDHIAKLLVRPELIFERLHWLFH